MEIMRLGLDCLLLLFPIYRVKTVSLSSQTTVAEGVKASVERGARANRLVRVNQIKRITRGIAPVAGSHSDDVFISQTCAKRKLGPKATFKLSKRRIPPLTM